MNDKINNNKHLPEWQQGEHAQMHYLERLQMMNEWLKKNNESILQTQKNKLTESNEVVGFIDL